MSTRWHGHVANFKGYLLGPCTSRLKKNSQHPPCLRPTDETVRNGFWTYRRSVDDWMYKIVDDYKIVGGSSPKDIMIIVFLPINPLDHRSRGEVWNLKGILEFVKVSTYC